MVDTMSEDAEELVKGLVIKPGANGRRTFSKAGKRALARRCTEPGVSVARMALLHGVNANLLRRWVIKYGKPRAALIGAAAAKSPAATLLPVTTPMPSVPRTPTFSESYIEITLSAATIRVRGAVDAALLDVVLECLGRRS
jgi:transposase-like protein